MSTTIKDEVAKIWSPFEEFDFFSGDVFALETKNFHVLKTDLKANESLGSEFLYTERELRKMLSDLKEASKDCEFPFYLKGHPQELYTYHPKALAQLIVIRKDTCFYVRSKTTSRAFKPHFFSQPFALPKKKQNKGENFPQSIMVKSKKK